MLIRERGKGRDGGKNGTNKRDGREMLVGVRRQKDESSKGPIVFLRQSLGIDRCKSRAEWKKTPKNHSAYSSK